MVARFRQCSQYVTQETVASIQMQQMPGKSCRWQIMSSRSRSRASRLFAIIVTSLGVAACDDHYVLNAYPQSSLIDFLKERDYAVGDTVEVVPEYDEICFIYPLFLISSYSDKDWDPDFSEDYFRILIKQGNAEQVEVIHGSWITMARRHSLCIDKDEEFFIHEIRETGPVVISKRDTSKKR